MIVQTANEPTALSSYSTDFFRHSKHRGRDAFHLILRDDRAIDIEKIHNLLPVNVVPKIQTGQLLLIIDFSLESSFHFVDTIYQHIIINLNIPEENILFVCSSYDFKDYVYSVAKRVNRKPINCEYYAIFERLSKNFAKEFKIDGDSPLHHSHEKLYINLNRCIRMHRVALLSLLYSNNLIDDGYNSFILERYGDHNHINRSWQDWLKLSNSLLKNHNIDSFLELDKRFPMLLDTDGFHFNLAYTDQNPIKKFVDKSLLSLVTETNFIAGKPLFLTEKTFKPIGMKHPFILVSCKGTLKFLRSLGYKTFDGIIDETYDNESDDCKRLELVINELNRIKQLSPSEIDVFKSNALPIVEHNYNVLMNKKTYLQELIHV